MAKWEKPIIVDASALERGLGDCWPGSTATDTQCANGEGTSLDDHACTNGGSAGSLGGCALGDIPDIQ